MKVKSGFVTLLGLPNAGKSTLFNSIIGEELAIVSPKPQTTWCSLRGHYEDATTELVVYDTPGVHEGTKALNQAIGRNAIRSIKQAEEGSEVIAFVVDAVSVWLEIKTKKEISIERVVRILENNHMRLPLNLPIIPTIQKIDLLNNQKEIDAVQAEVLRIAEKISTNVARPVLLSHVQKKTAESTMAWLESVRFYLTEDERGALFELETLTDRNLRDLAPEFIRESCYYLLGDELPYSIACAVEKYDESRADLSRIEATVYVEKDSQKSIVIGRGGEKIKKIGERSRKRLESILGKKVFLEFKVKVSAAWTKDAKTIQRFGYEER